MNSVKLVLYTLSGIELLALLLRKSFARPGKRLAVYCGYLWTSEATAAVALTVLCISSLAESRTLRSRWEAWMISIILTEASNLILEYWEIQKVFTARKKENNDQKVLIFHDILAVSLLFGSLTLLPTAVIFFLARFTEMRYWLLDVQSAWAPIYSIAAVFAVVVSFTILYRILMEFDLEENLCISLGFYATLLLSLSFSFTVSLWIQPIGSRNDVELLILQFLPAALGSISALSVLFSVEVIKRQEGTRITDTSTSDTLP